MPVADRTEVPVRLRLRVAPGARRSHVAGRLGEAWKVRVAASPEQGKANRAVVALLADALGVQSGDIAIVAGQTSRDKLIEVSGITASDAEERLATASGASA